MRPLPSLPLAWLAPLLSLAASCRFDPEPPTLPPRAAQAAPAVSSSPPALDLAPPLLGGLAAPVFHARLPLGPGQAVAPASVALVKGELSDVALRGLRDGELPASSRDRSVPLRVDASEGWLRVIPELPLDAGHPYTLAVGPLGLRFALIVADEPPALLGRLWPPGDEISALDEAVFCGPGALPEALSPVGFGPEVEVVRGALGLLDDERCLTVRASGADAPFPAAVAAAGRPVALLDPRPLARGSRSEPAPLACEGDEVALGPGCLLPLDDRAWLRLPPGPWLLLSQGEAPRVIGQRLLVRGLVPSSSNELSLTLVDLRGQVVRASASVVTGPPAPHMLLSEALADPRGPEPAAEWVELYNDGSTPVSLEGWTLDDGQGATPLPPHTVEPGAFALLTNLALDTSADVAPAPGCPLVPLPKLGKSGLSNQGEPLALRDPQGAVASRMPATPRPKPGVSLVRVRNDLPDDDPAAFALAPGGKPTPCGP